VRRNQDKGNPFKERGDRVDSNEKEVRVKKGNRLWRGIRSWEWVAGGMTGRIKRKCMFRRPGRLQAEREKRGTSTHKGARNGGFNQRQEREGIKKKKKKGV